MTKFWKKYFGGDITLKLKIGRMSMLIGAMGLLLYALVSRFVMNQKPKAFLASIIGAFVLLIVFYLTLKVKNVKNIPFCLFMFLDLLLIPYAFITSGGIKSANPIWMLLCIVFGFMFVSGWRLAIVTFLAIATDISLFMLNAAYPNLITEHHSSSIVRYDLLTSLIIASLILGYSFCFLNYMYVKEQKIAKERAEQIEKLSDSKTLFFANVSHEIRTPINSILGFNEIILRDAESEEVAENAANIRNASKILLSLINDILDFSKIESGGMKIIPAEYKSAELFGDIINIIQVRAFEKKLEFNISIENDIPSVLFGDEGRLKQVILNVLTNAVKYTDRGSVSFIVNGKSENDILHLNIEVADTGIGIKQEDKKALFDPFTRLEHSGTNKTEGTGLGLTISKEMLDLMGGKIKVDSIYQKGSSFTITVDQKIISSEPIGDIQHLIRNKAMDNPAYKQSFEAPNAEVLIVDDNELNLMVAKKLLRDTKIKVDTASSGAECLEKTRKKAYHLILMDHLMPEMNGVETLQKLRSREDGFCQKVPVIVVTANVMSNASAIYEEKGFNGYISKPLNTAVLEAAMLNFLPAELIEYTTGRTDIISGKANGTMLLHKRKKKICITADSICDLPEEWIEKFDINLIYCYVITEKGRFIDTKELNSAELLDYINSGKNAVSSSASEEEYEGFFSDMLMEAEQVIHISASSGIGKSYETAVKAAESFSNVTVVDSGQISSGMGIVVMTAAQMVQEGASHDEVINAVDEIKHKIVTSYIMPSVENMYRNGRVSLKIRNICRLLRIHPILCIRNNKIALGGYQLGDMDKSFCNYTRKMLSRHNIDKRLLFITYAGCSVKQLDSIRSEAKKRRKFSLIKMQKASSAISCNCGTSCFGLIYLKK